jgi:hypothetical protein
VRPFLLLRSPCTRRALLPHNPFECDGSHQRTPNFQIICIRPESGPTAAGWQINSFKRKQESGAVSAVWASTNTRLGF